MDILVFIDQYERGGAARVTSSMINGLVEQGYDVTLATNIVSRQIGYPLNEKIKVIPFYGGETHNKIQSLVRHIRLIYSARICIKVSCPDIIIAVTHYPYFYVRCASWFSKIPLIAVDHTSFSRKISFIEDWIRQCFYKYADVLSILTEKDRLILNNKFPNKRVIYNPLSFPVINSDTKRINNILVAGRLTHWRVKGIDRIIKIWANLAPKYPDWILEIAGDGDDMSIAYLMHMINDFHITDRVVFLGQISDMRTKFSETSIFALPSRVEGFPMVLMEAMSQGCASVTFSMGGASEEMMTNNKSGIIVEDEDISAFSKALELYLKDEKLRINHGKNAIIESSQFSPERFVDEWVSILNKFESKSNSACQKDIL